jgi:hypothetical protein
MNKYLQLLLLGVLVILVLFFIPRPEPKAPLVKDFYTCKQAGGVISTGIPTTCTSSDGQVYAEEEASLPEVILDTPEFGELISSPLTVTGRARGFWFFEANIPVTLKDQDGKILAQQGFQADGEWMTTEYVEFSDTLTFPTPTTEFGVLIISKDNPSGLEEFDASFAVPVRFK